jgi:hypothetical protein
LLAKDWPSKSQNLAEQAKNSNWKINHWFVLFIIVFFLLVGGITKLIWKKSPKN